MAWSPKNGGWVQSVHRPRMEPLRGRVDAWTRQPPHLFFLIFFLKHCIGPTIRIGRENWCRPYAGFFFFFPARAGYRLDKSNVYFFLPYTLVGALSKMFVLSCLDLSVKFVPRSIIVDKVLTKIKQNWQV